MTLYLLDIDIVILWKGIMWFFLIVRAALQ